MGGQRVGGGEGDKPGVGAQAEPYDLLDWVHFRELLVWTVQSEYEVFVMGAGFVLQVQAEGRRDLVADVGDGEVDERRPHSRRTTQSRASWRPKWVFIKVFDSGAESSVFGRSDFPPGVGRPDFLSSSRISTFCFPSLSDMFGTAPPQRMSSQME